MANTSRTHERTHARTRVNACTHTPHTHTAVAVSGIAIRWVCASQV